MKRYKVELVDGTHGEWAHVFPVRGDWALVTATMPMSVSVSRQLWKLKVGEKVRWGRFEAIREK